ncbi:Lactate dehydrogenase [Cohaesibacter sp. ES.047]|uniref:2-hydroxyacid dehydrogenase n=1 Tax=Cohaesibacter sp. ES.047 TaxID=1798205 RepID=UPI000BC0C417|nr:2-hydroxyacid dehydrogenase [Cohaesibacter sp. ES.047]SNY90737.1 Lactate dehydrogenase [Cohaesibacter sp. ES.047]
MSDILQLTRYWPATINEQLQALAPVHELSDYGSVDAIPLEIRERITSIASVATLAVDAAMMDALPNLKLISIYGVGYDKVDLEAARSRNVAIATTSNSLTDTVAELTIGLVLAGSRQLIAADRFVRSGDWLDGPMPLGFDIRGKTVGIFGFGRIGQKIAELLEVFGARVIYCARSEKPDLPYGYRPTIEALAEDSRVMILIAPGTPETFDIVNRDVLKRLGPDGLLVNVARGTLVVEDDLIAALEAGEIAGACLDVFAEEPKVPQALIDSPKTVLAPHIGSATYETRLHMGMTVIENIEAMMAGKPLLTPLDF